MQERTCSFRDILPVPCKTLLKEERVLGDILAKEIPLTSKTKTKKKFGESLGVVSDLQCAALMHHNCLPEDKMSNRCLSGWREPISHLFFVLLFHLPSYSSLMDCGQHTDLSTPQQTSCSVDERQMHYS